MTGQTVTVRHNFETAHRLPILQGKCQSLHGHSWWAEVTITCPTQTDVVVEFGAFKRALREWIDTELDHGTMLGADDPLVASLAPHGKVYTFGDRLHSRGLDWPTVENTARLLLRVATELLEQVEHHPGAAVTEVQVTETHVNRAGVRQ